MRMLRLILAAIVFFTTVQLPIESAGAAGPSPNAPASGQFFGVILVETYDSPNPYKGFHAIIKLTQPSGKLPAGTLIAVLSTSERLQGSFLSALATGFTVTITGTLLKSPPSPGGGMWDYSALAGVYEPSHVVSYNSKL